jgi:V/A-type H+-transporting ATPase subunit D
MRNVPPTKTNLLKIKEELSFASLGHELLDQKRGILVAELMSLVDQAATYEKNVDEVLAKAYDALEDASLAMGKLKVLSLSGAINIDASISIGSRKVMGVSLPVVETKFADRAPYYSAMGVDFRMDLAVKGFREALGLMGRFAELKVSIMRLAIEVRKTIRKVNALEKIAIPELEDTIRHIQNRLEENERDMFVLMKMVKNRIGSGEAEVNE